MLGPAAGGCTCAGPRAGGLCSLRRPAARAGLCEALAGAGAGRRWEGRPGPGRRFLSEEGPGDTRTPAVGQRGRPEPRALAGGGAGTPPGAAGPRPPALGQTAAPRPRTRSGAARPHGRLCPTRQKGGLKSRRLRDAGLESGQKAQGPGAALVFSPSRRCWDVSGHRFDMRGETWSHWDVSHS